MRSFAVIELIDDISLVPVKFKVLRRAPGFMLDWYIQKFNPFVAEQTEILGESGFLIRLPLTERDRLERPGYFAEMAGRTLHSLRDYDVEIVLPPAGGDFPDILPQADGRYAFPFFIMPAIIKMLKQVGKNIKNAEIVLTDGSRGLTLSILDNIYPHVNYLTVITEGDYEQKLAEIFDDCGLNVHAADYNRSSLENADIIINTQEDNRRFDYYYKRGAIYFDLSRGNGAELAAKREDMLIVDGLLLRGADGTMGLGRFECGLYTMSREYRRLMSGYDSRTVRLVSERVDALGYNVTGLCFQNRPVRPAGN